MKMRKFSREVEPLRIFYAFETLSKHATTVNMPPHVCNGEIT